MARRTKKAKLPANPQPKVWGYARVSTSEQDMRMQIDALTKAGVDPLDIFQEKVSGADVARRREFQAMMKELEPGDSVFVWKLDRLARSVLDLHQTIKTIDDRGCRLVVLTMPGMDTGTPTGRLLFALLAAVAEFERELTRERTVAGLEAARARGRIGGRTPKYGLEKLEEAYAMGGSFRAAALRLDMTLSGFKKALERERARAMLKDEE